MTSSHIDHLVVAADTLEHGVQWCEATLGVTAGPGGQHPLMGTHNRLLRLATPEYPQAYLEIIAIDPSVPRPIRRRWFDLDDEVLRAKLRQQPRLVHFVARTEDADSALRALKLLGIDRGPLVHAERETPHGPLRWDISVRPDGQRLFYGGLPTLLQWSGAHPVDQMPDAGLALHSVHVCHPRPADLRAAYTAIGLQGASLGQASPNLTATLATPRGNVILESAGA